MPALAHFRRANAIARPSWQAASTTLQSRSNQIRNDSAQGAGVGAPGTDPTYWLLIGSTFDGLSKSIAGVGSAGGIDYIDVRYAGTIATGGIGGAIDLEGSEIIAASSGQVWTQSAFLAVVGGSLSNVSAITLGINQQNSGGASNGTQIGSDIKASLSGALARFVTTYTLTNGSGTTTAIRPRVRIVTGAAGQAVDVTIRIGWPHIHLGASALSPIRTTGVARTGVHVSAGR